ncbi:MAG: AAA family ATPase [Deltaproteobacteria bacterium]|nr:MAG: AAA family ATPase [Deltaproteobacteria bacterium]
MSDRALETLSTLASLWERERRAARERYAAERRALTPAERVSRGIALADLAIDEAEPAPGGRTRLWLTSRSGGPIDRHRVKVGAGDPVVLCWRDPEEPDVVHGVVARFRRGAVGVVISGDPEDRHWAGGFRLERVAPEVTFDRGARALREWRSAPAKSDVADLRELLYGSADVHVDDLAPLSLFDPQLEDAQREAVRHALGCRPVALIHGPPGTGKTRTLVEVVRQAVRRGDRVLVTAASNTAVDNLAERLIPTEVSVVRLGHPARVLESVEDHTLDALVDASEAAKLAKRWVVEAHAIRRKADARSARGTLSRAERFEQLGEMRRLFGDARHHLRRAQEAILARHQVVCATVAGARSSALEGLEFDLVVLDEATQAPDPLALIALSRAPRAVLAGDPRQLPPTVIDREAEQGGLGVTAFERLVARLGDEVVRMLAVQHRMHADLMRFPSESMYDGRLVAAPTVAGHRIEQLAGVAADPLRAEPLVFVDTAGKGWAERRQSDDPSTDNPEQAERVAREVARLLGRGVAAGDIAVITPYDAQVRQLRDRLAPALADGLEIGTVDGFQGREKEAILLDLVRSNDAGEIGFLSDVRRMNVAITRARRLLIVVGDSATLGGHSYYRDFMATAEDLGAWTSAWADDAPPFVAV